MSKTNDKRHIGNIKIKNTIIIMVQYTIAENVPFIVQSHKYDNKINIYHSPSKCWPLTTKNPPCIVYEQLIG